MIIDSDYEDIKKLLSDKKFPLAICDLDAFNHNLEKVGNYLRKVKKKLRLCTKSVRVPEIAIKVEEQDFVNGLFTYNSAETLFYAERYQVSDILLGYPTTSKTDVEELCKAAAVKNVNITVMVDDEYQIKLLEELAVKNNVELDILIDVDVADKFLNINFGVLRSPLRMPERVVNLAQVVEKAKNLKFRGIMGYEAQNASVGDNKFLYRWLKKRSRNHVNTLRQDIVDSLINAGFSLEVVNGGGSGCFQETAVEPAITEIGIGSLLFKSHIFDPINSLKEFIPSMFFAIQIVRKPRNNIVTAFSGGYVSSGSGRALPKIVKPEGLKTFKFEEFGEVQTPLAYDPSLLDIRLGDPILCRFGKAGEPLEHFNEINVYSN